MQPSTKRHLPVVSPPQAAEASPTSPLLWVIGCCVVALSVWVPMAIASLKLAAIIDRALLQPGGSLGVLRAWPAVAAIASGLVLLSFGLACALGGLLLGRFAQGARITHVVGFSMSTVMIVLVFAALGNALRPSALGAGVAACLATIGTAGTFIGYWYGLRRRPT